MDGYAKGLMSADAVWVSRKYRVHRLGVSCRVSPPNILDEEKINFMT